MHDNFDEILQQSGVFRDAARFYAAAEGSALLASAAERMKSGRPVAIVGMGSSLFAGRILAEGLGACGIACLRLSAEELLGSGKALADYTTVLISQSGESGELIELVRQLPQVADRGVVITNTPGSTLAKACPKATLLMHAGEEQFSATKTFTNTLLIAGLLGARAAGRVISGEGVESLAAAMDRVIASTRPVLEAARSGQTTHADRSSDLGNLIAEPPPEFVVGCDTAGKIVAEQAGLLFKEVARARTEGHTLGTFRHGPQEVLVTHPRALFVAEQFDAKTVQYISDARDHGAVVQVIDHELLRNAGVKLDGARGPLGFAVAAATLIELWTVRASYANGYRPGHYLVGGKVTTALA